MDITEILKKVRRIEIKTKGLSKHLFAGQYHSAFKGRGMSFSEVRGYHYGDDIRDIDWNVTARTNDPHIKIYEEERELTIMLVIDMSASVFYGGDVKKSDAIAEIAAILAFSATSNNDKVGAILFSDKIEQYIPPRKGRQNILRIIREIISHDRMQEQTNIDQAVQYLANVQKKRCITFLISDFVDQGYAKAIKLVSRRHDLMGIHIYDELERSLPSVGIMRIRDKESDKKKYVNTWSKKVREEHSLRFKDHVTEIEQIFMQAKSDLVSITSNEDYVKKLMQLFKKRSGR